MEFNKSTFEAAIAGSKPVVVDFWASWCGPCRMQGPIFEEAAKALGDTAVAGKVNVDEEADLASRYGVMSIPTIIVFKNGKPVEKAVGVQQKARLLELVQAHI